MSIHDDIHDLIRLWDDLPAAILRIQGGPAEVVTGGAGPAPSPPLDVTAAETLTLLVEDVYAWSTAAERTLAEGPTNRTARQRLVHLPRQHDRLAATNEPDLAARLTAHASRWLADARRLIGLSHPDRRLGQYCPLHDDHLVELVAPGDQGHLSHTGQTISWYHVDAVTCRACRTTWTPPRYLDLRGLLERADERRLAAAAEQP